MKPILAAILLVFVAGCTTTPIAPSAAQQRAADAVEDLIAVGLVPVLSKNPTYLPVAKGVASALGTFAGSSLTPADVDAFLAKTTLKDEDKRTVAGIVNAAWATYQKRYAQQVGESIRPDVKLFLGAVSNGIESAIAAVPR